MEQSDPPTALGRRGRRLLVWGAALLVIAIGGVLGVAWTATHRSWPDGVGRFRLRTIPCGEGILHQKMPALLSATVCDEYQAGGFGWEALLADSQIQPVAADNFVVLGVRRSGWPCPALTGSWRTENGETVYESAWRWEASPTPRHMWAFLPTRPLWRGFAIDVAAYWTGLATVALATHLAWNRVMRRRLRLARGLCPGCGYPMGPTGDCPECGAPRPVGRSAV